VVINDFWEMHKYKTFNDESQLANREKIQNSK